MSFGPFGQGGHVSPGDLPWASLIHAAQPLAQRPNPTGLAGLFFMDTDPGTTPGYTLYRSDGTQWVLIGSPGRGSVNLNTLGTVLTGTWTAGIIGLLYGGTGASLGSTGPGVLKQTTTGAVVTVGQALDYIYLRDQQSSGTDGGTFTSGAWRTRVLNTEVEDTGGHCSLASNQFTLSAGTYRIRARAPGLIVNQHQTRLQNVSDSTTTLTGSNAYADATNNGASDSCVRGRFTIASSKAFELQHQCATTKATSGFGAKCSFGTEVYAEVELWREIS